MASPSWAELERGARHPLRHGEAWSLGRLTAGFDWPMNIGQQADAVARYGLRWRRKNCANRGLRCRYLALPETSP